MKIAELMAGLEAAAVPASPDSSGPWQRLVMAGSTLQSVFPAGLTAVASNGCVERTWQSEGPVLIFGAEDTTETVYVMTITADHVLRPLRHPHVFADDGRMCVGGAGDALTALLKLNLASIAGLDPVLDWPTACNNCSSCIRCMDHGYCYRGKNCDGSGDACRCDQCGNDADCSECCFCVSCDSCTTHDEEHHTCDCCERCDDACSCSYCEGCERCTEHDGCTCDPHADHVKCSAGVCVDKDCEELDYTHLDGVGDCVFGHCVACGECYCALGGCQT